MPPLESLLTGNDTMRLNSMMQAKIVVPPISRTFYQVLTGSGEMELLPAQSNKIYIINGYRMYANNTALTAMIGFQLKVPDYYDGNVNVIDQITLVANSVNSDRIFENGLNIPSMPGKPIQAYIDSAANYAEIVIYYTEVLI